VTAEPSVRDRAAEVLARLPLAVSEIVDGRITVVRISASPLDIADALAAAGLLAWNVTATHGCIKRKQCACMTAEEAIAHINAGFIMDADPADECTDPTCRNPAHYVLR